MATYIVTGSSRGLGLAMAKGLAPQDSIYICLVVAAARTCSPALEDVIRHAGGRVVFIPGDVSSESSILSSVEQASSALPETIVVVLINWAGGVHSGPRAKFHLCEAPSSGNVVSFKSHLLALTRSDLGYQFSVNAVGDPYCHTRVPALDTARADKESR
ncbi:hypothetical protein BBP40_009993 [Aspergillus hancockii]|nr:hypothetical protein BBP40_009993 [Aspergillus hancockii]